MTFELSSEAAWYVIQTKPKKEAEACRNLSGQGYQCLFPKILDCRTVNGRTIGIQKPLFPTYLFIRLILSQHFYKTKWTRGVARFVGWGNRPAPIPDEAIAVIRNRMDEGGRVAMVRELRPGVEVRIRSGPFKDLIGIFDGTVSPRGRVRVLLQLIDFQASVNLPGSLVEQT